MKDAEVNFSFLAIFTLRFLITASKKIIFSKSMKTKKLFLFVYQSKVVFSA